MRGKVGVDGDERVINNDEDEDDGGDAAAAAVETIGVRD